MRELFPHEKTEPEENNILNDRIFCTQRENEKRAKKNRKKKEIEKKKDFHPSKHLDMGNLIVCVCVCAKKVSLFLSVCCS